MIESNVSTEGFYLLKADTRKTLVDDGDCHKFLIPVSKLNLWRNLVENWTEDPYSFSDYPEWASRIEGGLLTFTSVEYNGNQVICEE